MKKNILEKSLNVTTVISLAICACVVTAHLIFVNLLRNENNEVVYYTLLYYYFFSAIAIFLGIKLPFETKFYFRSLILFVLSLSFLSTTLFYLTPYTRKVFTTGKVLWLYDEKVGFILFSMSVAILTGIFNKKQIKIAISATLAKMNSLLRNLRDESRHDD